MTGKCSACGRDSELVFNRHICVLCNQAYLMQNSQRPPEATEAIDEVLSQEGIDPETISESDKNKIWTKVKSVKLKPNKLTKPPSNWQPHHYRHIFTGTLVFFLGVAAHIALDEVKTRMPRDVKWQDGVVEHGFKRSFSIPTNIAQIGIADDGTLVWREIKK